MRIPTSGSSCLPGSLVCVSRPEAESVSCPFSGSLLLPGGKTSTTSQLNKPRMRDWDSQSCSCKIGMVCDPWDIHGHNGASLLSHLLLT